MTRTTTSLKILGALALSLGLAGSAVAGDETEFTRFVSGEQQSTGELQIAKATYRHPQSDVEIILYGVVHIADKAYFDAVQKDLDSYQSVLWEGVAPGKKKVKPDESIKGIGEMQHLMGGALGLTFQKDGIDYKRDHFVHADMNMDQLMEASGGDVTKALPGAGMLGPLMKNLGPMLKKMGPLLKTLMKSNPQMQNNMKFQFAQQLSKASDAMGGETQRVIIEARNKVCMEVLERELPKHKTGKIAIFYGAAHMKDFHERLAKLGFKQADKTWMTAWAIGVERGESETVDTPKKPVKKDTPKTEPKSGKRWF